ncbi:MAG: ABC transporter permease [Vicinamibacteraceae bacterium]
MLDALLRDVRLAIRMFVARPGWTAAAILCLAIATGANTAAFTIVNGLLLRPLPFEEPDRLVMVALREPKQSSVRPFALGEYRDLARRADSTVMLLARTYFPLSLASEADTRMTQAELVSGNYFETLRVKPFLGRLFDERADRDGSTPLVVLSHRLWERRFDRDPAAVGQSVRINGRPAVIAGVAPPGFVGAMQLIAADLWLPAALLPELATSPEASATPMFGVMGRLAPGVTADQAEARLTTAVASLESSDRTPGPRAVAITPAAGFGVPVGLQGVVLTFSSVIYTMMALLMAVACANVAALLLARGAGRSREIAVRLSLGASQLRIARQLFTESAVLALAGCAAGIFVALWLTQALVAQVITPFQHISYAVNVRPDARVFACSALATALAAILCGIAPIRMARRIDVVDALKESAAIGRSRASLRTLNATVVMQFAVSTMLLVAAGMLVRTYIETQSTQLRFKTEGLIASAVNLEQARIDEPAGIPLYQSVIERLSALPGVTEVGLTTSLPVRLRQTVRVFAEQQDDAAREPVSAHEVVVSSRYLQTLGLTLRQGRAFGHPEPSRPRVAIVNEDMARLLRPDASALGRTLRLDRADAEPIEIIGVVSNAAERPVDEGPQPVVYRPFPQEYSAHMAVVMRVQGDPSRLFPDVRRTIWNVNRDLSVLELRTMDDLVDTLLVRPRRIPATTLSLVGLLGLLLSAVGLYGVVAHGVRQRAHEIGIRLALGARPANVQRLVLRQGFTTVGIGLVIGAAATVAFTQVLRHTLFRFSSLDPIALVTVFAVLMAASLAALYLPARWASRVEPARTLRSE